MRTAKQAAAFYSNLEHNKVGMCLWHVQDAFQSRHAYPNAIGQWNAAKHKHRGDRTPKVGAPVYWGGTQHGHIAIYVGNGRVRSSDAGGAGRMATVPLGWFERHWGMTYLGWTEDINGRRIEFDDKIDVYVAKLHPGVDNSNSVRVLRKVLIKRGYLVPARGLSAKKPGDKYTAAVQRAVRKWEKQKGFRPSGVLNNVQAKVFFAPNTKVQVHPK